MLFRIAWVNANHEGYFIPENLIAFTLIASQHSSMSLGCVTSNIVVLVKLSELMDREPPDPHVGCFTIPEFPGGTKWKIRETRRWNPHNI